MRERDRHPVELVPHDLFDAQLVVGIEKAEQQGDRDRAESLVTGASGGGADGFLVERRTLLAAPVEASRDLNAVRERNERRRLPVVEVVEARTVSAGDVVHVARALGGKQEHLLAPTLQECVQADGGSVNGEGDRGGRVDHLSEPGEDPFRQVMRRGRRLARGVRSVILVVRDDIGERPPDVH